jgi:hypothetical protein
MVVISPFIAASRGNVGALSFSHIHVDQGRSANWRELYPDWYRQRSGPSQGWDMDEEGEAPLFSLNGHIESLTLNDVVTKAINPRPIIRVGPTSRIQLMNVDLSIHDPDSRAVPLKLMGHIQRLKLSLDWTGVTPIQYEGGAIERLDWVTK